MKNRTVIIIPARYGSSRYRGKPLVKILGRELVLRVADVCKKTVGRSSVYIATDSKKIANVVEKSNYKAIFTSRNCLTGTDRVAEATKKINAKTYINVQGDEPLVNPRDIKAIINAKKKFPNYVICGYDKIHKLQDPKSLNLPKVVVNSKKELIYISRSLIPGSKKTIENKNYFKQVCIYAFNKKELTEYSGFGRKGTLELIEDIEILRFLDIGLIIRVVETKNSSIAVDVPLDVKRVEEEILRKVKN